MPRSAPSVCARAALSVVIAASVVGTGPAAASVPTMSPSSSAGPLPEGDLGVMEGWVLVWSDEFDGAAGSSPDPATWAHDLGDGSTTGLIGWGNNERQWYSDDPSNVALDGDGHLAITAHKAEGNLNCYYGPCEYTSGRVLTKDRFEFQHGYLEARIQVPGGYGLWPAFWLLGANLDDVGWPASGEIDVMEFVGRRPNEVLGTLHGPGYSGSGGISGWIDLGMPVADAFRTVALEWEPDRLAWYLDGQRYHEVNREQVAPNEWVFEQPFFMLLNVAVGGNLGGPVFPDTAFPSRMLVDYVRLYQPEPS